MRSVTDAFMWSNSNYVKLLRWQFFHFFVFQHYLQDRFHCQAMRVSAETLNRRWVVLGGYELLVGQWVVAPVLSLIHI